MKEQQVEGLRDLGNALHAIGEAVIASLAPSINSLAESMQGVHDLFWKTYIEAGAPYGETEDGMMKWYDEIGEAKRLQYQADRILEHHKMLADFRARKVVK